MSPNYFCLNFFLLVANLLLIIGQNAFSPSANIDENYNTTQFELPFYGQCASNGTFGFNVDFRLLDFRELLLANGITNKCLNFVFHSAGIEKNLKPQFNGIINENLHHFKIYLCLNVGNILELYLEKRNITLGIIHSSINFLRLQFEGNNFRIFYQINEDKGMEEIIISESISLYNGNKMLQKNPSPWMLFLLKIAFIKKITTEMPIRIQRPKICVLKVNSSERSISIDCIPSGNIDCEEKPNQNQCGQRCRKNLNEKHHREALISRGQSITDSTKWPWMVALKLTIAEITDIDESTWTTSTSISKCSGTIIHPNYVLTAAHCLKQPSILNARDQLVRTELLGIEIFAGHFNISDPNVQIIEEKPTNVIVHENYTIDIFDENLDNIDMALIKLSKPLKFNEQIRPICLTNFTLENEKIVRIAGWGIRQELDYERLNIPFLQIIYDDEMILQESMAKVIIGNECLSIMVNSIQKHDKILTDEEKREGMEKMKELFKSKYCLLGMDNSTTQGGDSGGPMMYSINGTWFTFGISSGGLLRKSLQEKPLPIYYTKIDCDWIQNKTEGEVHCSHNGL